jgi:2-dehydro-3-deoxy-D-arabinonate dehydratase
MRLSRHDLNGVAQWALDGRFLLGGQTLADLLRLTRAEMLDALQASATGPAVQNETLLSPAEPTHEVWASGVTYLRSRDEREAESTIANLYSRVYEAERPELFFKSMGLRTVPHLGPIRIRRDSDWNVPEPELTLVVNAHSEIVGYTAGNDVSSRSIEGENPLYLPQAKTYRAACALGPDIILIHESEMTDLLIECTITRQNTQAFHGTARTSQMKRSFPELVEFLTRELDFPIGAFLLTGTGIVPSAPFTLLPGDTVRIKVGAVTLENPVAQQP